MVLEVVIFPVKTCPDAYAENQVVFVIKPLSLKMTLRDLCELVEVVCGIDKV